MCRLKDTGLASMAAATLCRTIKPGQKKWISDTLSSNPWKIKSNGIPILPSTSNGNRIIIPKVPSHWFKAIPRRSSQALLTIEEEKLLYAIANPPHRRGISTLWHSKRLFEQMRTDSSSEFMAFTWILEGILDRVGFTIEKADYPTDWFARYICKK